MRRPVDRRPAGRARRLAWGLAAALLAGCSFDYRSTSLEDELSEAVPNTVLLGVEHTVVRDGRVAAVLRVDRVESYDERDVGVLYGIHFTEFDRSGSVVTEAWADRAEYHLETDDARAEGSVVVESRRDDARIAAAAMRWRESERMLTSDGSAKDGGAKESGAEGGSSAEGGGAEVVIERGDGSRVTAAGFEADVARRVIRFLGPVSGRLAADR